MNITAILIAAAVIAVAGIIVGIGLGLFGEKFKVEVDEKEVAIREELPGNNCGGCGFAGCDALAKAIAEGKAPAKCMSVGGAPVGERSLLSLAYLPEQQRRRLHLYVVKVPVTRLRLFTTTKVLMTVQRHL